MQKVPPLTPSKTLAQKYQKGTPKPRINSRREDKPRFGSRKLPGAAKTLVAKKVVWLQIGPPGRSAPTMKHTNSVGTGVLDGPKSRGEEIACNLVAACRLPLGRPPKKRTNLRGRVMHAPTAKIVIYLVGAIHESLTK